MIGNLFLIHGAHSRIFGHRFLLFDIGGAVSILVMGTMLVFSSIKTTYTLYKLEPMPKPQIPSRSPTVREGSGPIIASSGKSAIIPINESPFLTVGLLPMLHWIKFQCSRRTWICFAVRRALCP